jgi:Flp pilus assembly protein TadG
MHMSQQINIKRFRREDGQSMTEFAIVLPIFCVLLFGVIQFGILWNNYVTLTDATRAGARKAAVSRHGAPVTAACTQVRASASDLKGDLQCSASVTGPLDRPGGDVKVTATYPYNISLLGFVVASGRLNTTQTERME